MSDIQTLLHLFNSLSDHRKNEFLDYLTTLSVQEQTSYESRLENRITPTALLGQE